MTREEVDKWFFSVPREEGCCWKIEQNSVEPSLALAVARGLAAAGADDFGVYRLSGRYLEVKIAVNRLPRPPLTWEDFGIRRPEWAHPSRWPPRGTSGK